MKKIGIFGGLFDPPHIGHLIIAQSVLEELHLDKVIFVPAGNPPHKLRYSPYTIRYKMTEIAIKDNKKFSISNIEKVMLGKTYTVEVVRELRKKIRGTLYLIIGSDQWLEIETWRAPQKLFKECRVVVVPRPGYKIEKPALVSKKIFVSNTPLMDISSSDIREQIGKKGNIQYLVVPAVYSYIKRRKLYI